MKPSKIRHPGNQKFSVLEIIFFLKMLSWQSASSKNKKRLPIAEQSRLVCSCFLCRKEILMRLHDRFKIIHEHTIDNALVAIVPEHHSLVEAYQVEED